MNLSRTKLSAALGLLLLALPAPLAAQIGAAKKLKPEVQSDPRVSALLDEAGIKYTVDSDGDYKVTFNMSDTRTQVAFVRSSTSEYDDLEIREIWSYAYATESPEQPQFSADLANRLLEENNTNKMGCWAKQGHRAVFVVHVAAEADVKSFRSCLEFALLAADTMEEQLSGDTDEF